MATIAAVEHHVNELQQALVELARLNDRTARTVNGTAQSVDRLVLKLDRLSDEMREFKEETRKAEASLRDSLNKQNADLSGGMAEFKNEMAEFKNEMAEFKNEMAEFKNETRKGNADLRADLNRQNARLSDTLGRLAEDIVGPSIPTLFKRFFPGSEPEFAMRISKKHRVSGDSREFDTPAWNDTVFLVSETKSKLRPSDLDTLAETIADVRNFFPEADGKKICAALASLYIDPTLVKGGEKRGFIMIALGNDLAEVLNSEGFKPAEF